MPLLKFMNDDDRHYEMIYGTGFNEDLKEFDNTGNCQSDGIYVTVTTLDNHYNYINQYGSICMQDVYILKIVN